ncbi:MAG: DNA primase [Bacillota bacterium]
MAQFDQAFKDEVRAKNDIVEVISSYVKLERRGNRYVGLCPFHSEKTPSFHVIPDQQFYHCFGCKASGDVFTFVQQREHMTFYETVVHLAQRARIPLPKEERTPEEEKAYRERRAMYEALDLAARFFHHQLLSDVGKPGLDYLLRRGLSEETIRRFRLGWAPGRGALYRTLKNRFPPEMLQKVGLILPRRDGSGYTDAFFDRVMFPIADLAGRVIGFGGRILEGQAAKYKNTAETPLFSKRQLLFGLDQAKEAMRARNQAILVEGYMDVIMPHQYGIQNVVAPLGTALTDEQCRMIRQQAAQAIVAFDMDTAGQMATLRGLEKLYDTGCDVRVLQIPDGKDPDEYIREHGVEAFERALNEAIPLIEFKLRNAMVKHEGSTPEAKARALESVARVLADVRDEVLREAYADQVAEKLAGQNPLAKPDMKVAIDRQMNRLLRQGFQHNQPDSRNNRRDAGETNPTDLQPQGPPDSGRREHSYQRPDRSFGPRSGGWGEQPPARPVRVDPPVTAADGAHRAERALLYLLLQSPVLLRRIEADLGATPFEDPHLQALFTVARPICLEPDPFAGGSVVARVLDRLSDPDARLVLTEMVAKPIVTSDSEKEAADCIEKIRKHRDSRRIEDLRNLIRATEASKQKVDPAIVLELTELIKKQKPSRS